MADVNQPHPTALTDRIVALDMLRGVAVLGILVINIWVFSMPGSTIEFPMATGTLSGAEYAVWLFSHVFFELKMYTLFALLFGAGILLFTTSKERRDEPVLSLHFRRTGLLLVAGLAHAYLLWFGDILVGYALCAFVVVFLRHWQPLRQAMLGIGLVVVPFALWLAIGLFAPEGFFELFEPTQETIDAEIAAYQGSWLEQMAFRVPGAIASQTLFFVIFEFWRTAGLMLLGMALFKWGILADKRSGAFYRRLLLGGGIVGLSLISAGVWYNTVNGWSVRASFLGMGFNYWGSIPLASAYIAGITLWSRWRTSGILTKALTAVGQTAFSNYIFQTILATSIFYGHGLGLFGTVNYLEAVGIVILIWTIQIPLSVLWLRRYRFGPLEWVWRTLTYGERQPLRRVQ